ncbi:MAG TPA: VTT domain-containing protein [Ornithinibacter sp.]|nr:VTT domain-containing protein [Ornithinibacter sp.]
MLETLTTFIEAQAAAPWVLLLVLLVSAGDALVPPVPSDPVVVALAAVSVAGDGPNLLLLGASAALGAFVGDTTAYLAGRRFGRARLSSTPRPALRRALGRAQRTLEHRGGLVILVARYVPVGRVAVNLTAGATAYPRRRFLGFATLAALSWSAWSVAVGALAGRWMADNPLVGAAAGVTVALLLGLAADVVARRVLGWARSGSRGTGGADEPTSQAADGTPASAAVVRTTSR